MKALFLILLVLSVSVCGCFNRPTSTAQIVGTYVSPIEYEDKTVEQLTVMLNSLSQRENQLVLAQTQRIKSSRVQEIWFGVGNGDGVEASELANVRGKKQAVKEALALKGVEV